MNQSCGESISDVAKQDSLHVHRLQFLLTALLDHGAESLRQSVRSDGAWDWSRVKDGLIVSSDKEATVGIQVRQVLRFYQG